MKKKFEIVNNGGIASIKIIGEINWWSNSAESFTSMVDNLLSQGIVNVDVYINTPGGSMFDANEIGNQLLRFTGVRNGKLGALCASAGTTVSTYLQNVVASKNTQYMIHDPRQSVVIEHEEDYDQYKKLYQNLRNNAIACYMRKTKTKMSKKEISEAMRITTWYTAEEALEKGFVDAIDEEMDNVLPPDTQDVFQRYGVSITDSMLNQIQSSQQTETENNEDMKKIALRFKLPENATEDQILAAINAELKTAQENSTKMLVKMGVAKGLKKELIEKMANADFDTAEEWVNDTLVVSAEALTNGSEKPNAENKPDTRNDTLTNILEKLVENTTKPSGEPDMSFSEMANKDKARLIKMVKETPEKALELYKKEYGTNATINDLKDLIG